MILGIDVVFLHVKDPDKLSQWYKNILELELGFITPDKHWQEFNLPERNFTRFAIDYVSDQASIVEKQKIMVSFKVLDIHSCVEKLESKGIEFFGDPKINDVGPTLVATFQDIEGNWLQISQRK